MTPDVRAVREAALAALGLPVDTPATFDAPATAVIGPVGLALPGWVSYTCAGLPYPRVAVIGPDALRIVLATGQSGTLRALVHLLVWRALESEAYRFAPAELRAAVEVPGAFAAAAEADRVGGWPAAAQVLLEVTR